MVIDPADVGCADVKWSGAVRIIRSVHPPIDLFEDIADPADWPLLIAAEQKTNPRLMETIGNLDQVPEPRRVSGPGASYLMASFTHFSPDRDSRLSDGTFGVLYIASDFETALYETTYHHAAFMARTDEPPGWTSQFREIVLGVAGQLHDLRHLPQYLSGVLDANDYTTSQSLGGTLRGAGSEGVIYPSVRGQGDCVGLFYPDLALSPTQGRHLDYHWDGARVDLFRDRTSGDVFRIDHEASPPG